MHVSSLRRTLAVVVGMSFCLAVANRARAEDVVFPEDSAVIDITKAPYYADNTGVADVTAVIQQAINRHRGSRKGRTIYFPDGVYKVSSPLLFSTNPVPTDDPPSNPHLTFQGQSRDGTIFRLADNSPAYCGTCSPKPVISTFEPSGAGGTNVHFDINFFNLTIDIGSGNPKAIGLTYYANNQGSVRDVRIVSRDFGSGVAGVDMRRFYQPGPAMLQRVEVIGFDYGIDVARRQYSVTFENIKLTGQRLAAIRNDSNVINLRRVTSSNSVPAIINVNGVGAVTVVDSNFENGAAEASAIDNRAGFLFARNISTTGYKAAITDRGNVVPVTRVTEYVSHGVSSLHPTPPRSLNLPVEETPEVEWDDPESRCAPQDVPCASGTWANVRDFGATQGDGTDDADAIQAAMNSGATTVYFPNSADKLTTSGPVDEPYRISRTVAVGPNVRRITGLMSLLQTSAPLTGSTDPIFLFKTGNHPVVVIERLRVVGSVGNYYIAHHASSKKLVMRNILTTRGLGYRNSPPEDAGGVSGDLFIEDVNVAPLYSTNPGPQFVFSNNQRVWARQINPEAGGTKIVNDGATLWILGIKIEGPGTVIETKNKGRTEVLGGFIFPVNPVPPTVPAFINDDSRVSIVALEEKLPSGVPFGVVVQERRDGGAWSYLYPSQVPKRPASSGTSTSFVLPLYVGYDPATTLGAIADAHVRDGSYANTNYGTSAALDVKTSSTGYNRVTYLKFDLTGVASVGQARLRILAAQTPADTQPPSITTSVYPVAGTAWSETAVTWNNRPARGSTALGSAGVAGTVDAWYEIDVTGYVQAEKAAGRNVISLALRNPASSTPLVRIKARETGESGPQLVVTS